MPKVKCNTLATDQEINGFPFVSHASGGVVSGELSEEDAANFASIPGYEIFDPKAAANVPTDLTEEQISDLRTRAVTLGVPHAKQLGVQKLLAAVAESEKANAPK